MKARLVRDNSGIMILLCTDGTMSIADSSALSLIFANFKRADEFTGNDGTWLSTCKDMSMYPGETVAYISDDSSLVIIDPSVLYSLSSENSLGPYISITEYAKKVNRSRQIIKVFCREGRLLGARKVGETWVIPENSPYPVPLSRRHD